MAPKAQFTKEPIDKLDFIKIENILSLKNTKRMKTSHNLGEIFTKHMFDKDLYPAYIKNCQELPWQQENKQAE